jgi:hypothetical protein
MRQYLVWTKLAHGAMACAQFAISSSSNALISFNCSPSLQEDKNFLELPIKEFTLAAQIKNPGSRDNRYRDAPDQ